MLTNMPIPAIASMSISRNTLSAPTIVTTPRHAASTHTGWTEITISAVKHTLEVSIIVFLISLALVAIMEVAGEEAVAAFLASNPGLAIFGSGAGWAYPQLRSKRGDNPAVP